MTNKNLEELCNYKIHGPNSVILCRYTGDCINKGIRQPVKRDNYLTFSPGLTASGSLPVCKVRGKGKPTVEEKKQSPGWDSDIAYKIDPYSNKSGWKNPLDGEK